MKKLGLCVRYDCNNYGSMLQILALEKMIEKTGWEYEVIRYNKMTASFLIKNMTRVFNPYFMHGKITEFSKKRELKKYPSIEKNNHIRNQLFQKYRETYLGPYSPVFIGYEALQEGTKRYDAIMVGSDQLWTPAGIKSKFYNLLFVPDEIRKISFATSFGVTEVPKNQTKETKKYLDRIEYLSVREDSGAKIVKDLTDRNATVALDPTLMLNKEEWEEVFPYQEVERTPYVFAFFLGDNAEHRKQVEALARKTNLRIVTCPHINAFVENDLHFGNVQRYDISPVDFLNLIRGAEYVCTDSFHGTVFSILNHMKFITFYRFAEGKESRNTRIDNLLGLLKLEDRISKSADFDIVEKADEEIFYPQVDALLEEKRKESFAFLQEALL